MAINLFEKQCDKIHSKYSFNSPKVGQLVKLSIAAEGSIPSGDSKSSKTKKKSNSKSPYLTGDSVQLLLRFPEKKIYSQNKKSSDMVSSLPLAANIYKANSDEFKAQKKGVKKVKKSVLTLPNAPTDIPKQCTVSDMNDSEYCNGSDDNHKLKAKKRFVQKKKHPVRNKNYEFYDRDARYCSQMNISLDCSSTDTINHFTGDGKRVAGKFLGRKSQQNEQEYNAHDVWAVLRNINRFQFRPSPPISEDSLHSKKKKKNWNRRRNNHVIETCQTEEFAYISRFEVDSKSPRSFSQSSSFDRITVIDKEDEFNEMRKEFEKRTITKNLKVKNQCPNTNKNQSRKNSKNLKSIGHKEQNDVNGPRTKSFNDSNKTRDMKAYECQLKGNNFESPETLVSMNCELKVISPPKKSVGAFRNPEKIDAVKVIDNRSNELDYSLCSESSKVGITANRKDINKVSSGESDPHLKGITKVILNRGQALVHPKNNEIRKPRLATTMPSTTMMPKLTQTEIKRRLANLKFPIVILGKEQLSSATINVMNNDPPNLEGLNQCIWPFMQDWFGQTSQIRVNTEKDKRAYEKFAVCNSPRYKHQAIEHKINQRKFYEANANKQLADKNITCLNIECTPNKKKSFKRPLPNEITILKPQDTKKPKPIHQLKDKMLKLLYKNSSTKCIDEQFNTCGRGQDDTHHNVAHTVEVRVSNASKKVDVGTGTFMKYELGPHGLFKNVNASPRSDIKKLPVTKQPWAKAKWASDFIETVINKIRSGIYFSQESKQRCPNTDFKEASIQTVVSGKNLSINEEFMENIQGQTSRNEVALCKVTNYLPGFDNSLPALEIKTMNMKEVAVKYGKTNVMVQFDVAVPSNLENLNPLQNSSSYVPLAITESNTKIFKCKTTIVNAMLPAEICSLLPKIIRSIIDSNKKPPLSPTKFQNESLLYTISELCHCESTDILKSSLPTAIRTNISPTLLKLFHGAYPIKKTCKKSSNIIPKLTYSINSFITKDLLMDISVQRLLKLHINPLSFGIPKADVKKTICKQYFRNCISETNSCTTLDLYRERNPIINMIPCNNSSVLENLWKSKMNIQFKIPTFPYPLNVTLDYNKITVSLNKKQNDDDEAIMGEKLTVIDNLKIDSLYNGKLYVTHDNTSPLKAIQYKNHADNYNNMKNNKIQNQTLLGTKTRKKSFVKLYKKCKSTSNISGERHSTSLSKIINLDDFFQALGSSKLLSSVFDGLSGKKILSSIREMKNWITDISQRQAMLVLLLTNKKDTPNLVRFRPILLQGIAVNRITRASELDMEIEVIEREHFSKFSQFQGIPSLEASVENQDNLMEELYWIAKTTASDYQRPFNDASERLLSSLLEKRKKLNPSYLRVMARYVGLGLLNKCPKN